MAAGLILVREAGGFVTDCDGGDDMFAKGHVVAGNEAIQKELLRRAQRGRQGLTLTVIPGRHLKRVHARLRRDGAGPGIQRRARRLGLDPGSHADACAPE